MSSLSGDNNNNEPLPAAWANRQQQPRIGRIGGPATQSPARNSGSGGGRLATLRDIGPRNPMQPPSRHQNSDDEDDQPQNFFAGGERSGLSVQNPNHPEAQPSAGGARNQVRDILRRAEEGARSYAEREATRSGPFRGTGHTLGSDEAESSYIADPSASSGQEQETAIRNITFWRDGFTIEDGPLRRYDDETSSELLAQINSGHAPPSVLNVTLGQPVELRVSRRVNEDYVPPPPGPFAGQGHRLGSPVPESIRPSAPQTSAPQPPASVATSNSFEVDLTAPMTSIQIRLADGTRLVCRVNLTHTVGDIRRFINASRPGNASLSYIIQTTLPVKALDDEAQTIEAAGLKNSVVVQRLT